jgi:nicotinate-nucleotide adenylyltransferase
MRVGLFFGTFNPLHNAHLGICNKLLEKKIIDEVWLVLTPHSPYKKSDDLVDAYIRLDMINEAIAKLQNIKVSDIEFGMEKPNYTYLTLKEVKKSFQIMSI